MTTKIEVVRGDSIPFAVDSIVDQAGDSISDLTGWKCFFALKNQVQDPDSSALVTRSTTSGNVSVVGSAFFFNIDASESEEFPAGVPLAWDIRIASPSGDVMTPLRGTLTLCESISQTTT